MLNNNTIDNNIDVLIYPNPAKDRLSISIPASFLNISGGYLLLYNSIGALVLTQRIEPSNINQKVILELEDIPNGIYLLSLRNQSEIQNTTKITINK